MPLIGACCEHSWCKPVEARVRSVGVVVDPPFFDDPARLAQVREHMLVETLVTLVETLVTQAALPRLDQARRAD